MDSTPPDNTLNTKYTASAVGLFYEQLTAQAFGFDFEQEGSWDLTAKDGVRVEVKASGHYQWKILRKQIDDYNLDHTVFIFWKWCFRRRQTEDGWLSATSLGTTHKLWKWLSWHTKYGFSLPGRLVQQLLESSSVRDVFLYNPPGRWKGYLQVRHTLFDYLTRVPQPRPIGVNRWSVKKSKVVKIPVFNEEKLSTSAPFYIVKNHHPFKSRNGRLPF